MSIIPTIVEYNKIKYNYSFVKKTLLENILDYDYDEFPDIEIGDWILVDVNYENNFKCGIIVDIDIYNPCSYINSARCENTYTDYCDIIIFEDNHSILECKTNYIIAHLSFNIIQNILNDIKKKKLKKDMFDITNKIIELFTNKKISWK